MTLEEIREEIDQIDQQMKALFLKRMDCARRVAETKARTGGDVYVAEREAHETLVGAGLLSLWISVL